ncbi:MAG TPA: pyridoxamine 5'-phosphate oxidase family protein [Roseiflexaceae bacterium]|nr:pyridoxamine 5'-phosphate oxidase family protein [Roseiflexaceae bacterium]
MIHDEIEQWEHTQAELAIRRWLYSIGMWAPEAERAAQSAPGVQPAQLSAEQIDQLLRSEVVGRIGCSVAGEIYVVPVFYAYDGTYIYGHSNEGMKIRMLRAKPKVCFEVDHVDSLVKWQSVIAWGQFEELQGEQAEQAERLLIQRVKPLLADALGQPHRVSGPADPGGDPTEGRAIVFRIALTERTGRATTGP